METVCMAMSDWVFIIWGPLSTFWFKKGALEYISENSFHGRPVLVNTHLRTLCYGEECSLLRNQETGM